MLTFLKIIHTIIWAVITFANFYAFYLGFIGRFDIWFWSLTVLLALEICIIILNGWECPITNVIKKYTKDRSDNFGLYIPGWLAKYNVRIYTVVIPLEVIIVFVRWVFFK